MIDDSKQMQGPWLQDTEPFIAKDGEYFTAPIDIGDWGMKVAAYGETADEAAALRRRIVACINACAGITTESLAAEGKDALDIAAAIKILCEQRDELEAVLRKIEPVLESHMYYGDEEDEYNDNEVISALDLLRAALAKVKS